MRGVARRSEGRSHAACRRAERRAPDIDPDCRIGRRGGECLVPARTMGANYEAAASAAVQSEF